MIDFQSVISIPSALCWLNRDAASIVLRAVSNKNYNGEQFTPLAHVSGHIYFYTLHFQIVIEGHHRLAWLCIF